MDEKFSSMLSIILIPQIVEHIIQKEKMVEANLSYAEKEFAPYADFLD